MVTIEADKLALKTGKTWKGIDLQLDEAELKQTLVGNTGNKKVKTEFEAKISGLRDEVLGWLAYYKNTPMVVVVADNAGNLWVIGTKTNGAFVESGDATSGKKVEDDSGLTLKLTANSKLYRYAGTITEGTAPVGP